LSGGGIICRFDSSSVNSNTVVANDATDGAGILCRYSAPLILQNILCHNLEEGQGVVSRMCTPGFGCNDIWGNSGGDDWEGEDLGGNFSLDPLFCDLAGNDFRLQPASPCWPGADCGLIGASDVDCDGQDVPDIGTQSQYLPQTIELRQNYPNPFNPTTTIEFSLSYPAEIQLTVYNTLGQRIMVLAGGRYSAGVHQVQFNGSRLTSGVFVCRLVAGKQVVTRKMILLK